MEDRNNQTDKDVWSGEAWQNWIGFWNLISQEDMKQNPRGYKKLIEKEKLKNLRRKLQKKL